MWLWTSGGIYTPAKWMPFGEERENLFTVKDLCRKCGAISDKPTIRLCFLRELCHRSINFYHCCIFSQLVFPWIWTLQLVPVRKCVKHPSKCASCSHAWFGICAAEADRTCLIWYSIVRYMRSGGVSKHPEDFWLVWWPVAIHSSAAMFCGFTKPPTILSKFCLHHYCTNALLTHGNRRCIRENLRFTIHNGFQTQSTESCI